MNVQAHIMVDDVTFIAAYREEPNVMSEFEFMPTVAQLNLCAPRYTDRNLVPYVLSRAMASHCALSSHNWFRASVRHVIAASGSRRMIEPSRYTIG